MADTILKAEHLTKTFISGKKTLKAVDDVSFELKQGECLGIVGESGSGKSTIAKMLTHLESITDGKVILKGKDITQYKRKRTSGNLPGIFRWYFRCQWNPLIHVVRSGTESEKA